MPRDSSILAVYCDLENVAIGAREAKFSKFDIGKVLDRLLVKGNIVVKKAYCDWQRFEAYKRPMHEAAFELIDIPHVRQSGKNSADIRMVVDALDLCYTKAHVDAFVIISGDSDFSPLVSKLRENNKVVIGLGVKHSTSDLFVANCDEFIFYDDLVTQSQKKKRPAPPPEGTSADPASRRDEAVDLVVLRVALELGLVVAELFLPLGALLVELIGESVQLAQEVADLRSIALKEVVRLGGDDLEVRNTAAPQHDGQAGQRALG